jgi:NitT/TauT family transport system permease protein
MNIIENVVKAIARGVIAILILAVVWQAAATVVGDKLLMPALPAVFARLGQLLADVSFWGQAWASFRHFGFGYVPALIGIPLGFAFAAVVPLRFIFGGLFNGLAGAPLIASAPLMTFWFKLGDNSKIALVFLVAFVTLTSDVMTDLARNAAPGVSPEQAPGAARCIVAALRRSFVLAITAALVGEMVASANGLGYLLMNSMAMFDIPMTVAVLVAVILPCAAVVAIARGIEGLV